MRAAGQLRGLLGSAARAGWGCAGRRRGCSRGAAAGRQYERVFRASVGEPARVWGAAAERIEWFKPWERVLDAGGPRGASWFVDGELNICYNAVDRHVENGRGNQIAIMYDSPVTNIKEAITFKEVLEQPKLIVAATFGIEPGRKVEYIPLLEGALAMTQHKPEKVLIYHRPNLGTVPLVPGRDLDWDEELAKAQPHDCVAVSSDDPLYILYTSGTTGLPKGKPVGTPDAGAYFRVLAEHEVAAFFTSPTAIRAIRQQDPEAALGKQYSLTRLRTLFVAGEHCDVETLEWSKKVFKVPVLDHWWQTETGSAITASCIGLGNSTSPPPGQAGKPVPGYNVMILDNNKQTAKTKTLGNIVVKLPLPPGAFSGLWENQEMTEKIYFQKFPGYYDTMDAGYMDEEGYLYVLSRVDDVINIAGHRISAGAIEEIILSHGAVTDCAVVGLEDALKGHVPLALCVLRNDVKIEEEKVLEGIVKCVRQNLGPVAAFQKAVFVKQIPKTRSGKIPRSALSALVNGNPYQITPTIEDPHAFKHIEEVLKNK